MSQGTHEAGSTNPAPTGRNNRRWRRGAKVLAALGGVVVAGGTAYAATNWIVGLSSGSSGAAQSGSVSNLAITAVATPASGNLLYPGGTGDVVVNVNNPNSFPVTITAVNLPTSTTYAAGYSNSTLSTAQTGCSTSTSNVAWSNATSTSGSSHTLATPLIVGSNASLTVTLTNAASMGNTAPAACESTYFSMPSLTGVAASAGGATATTSPATDSWSS
jgi:hypothetical protein